MQINRFNRQSLALGILGLRLLVIPALADSTPPADPPASPVIARVLYHGKKVRLDYQTLAVTLDRERSTDPKLCASPTNTTPVACNVLVAKGEYEGRPAFELFAPGEEESLESGDWAPSLTLRELDRGTPTPQAIFAYSTGGAHCCTSFQIATIDAAGLWHVVDAGHRDGDVGYAFLDLKHDGSSELVGIDESFLYEFASYAGSFAPTSIMKLDGTVLRDVTKSPEYRAFLIQQLRMMETLWKKNPGSEVNGYLAGWVAQKSLLGQANEAWRAMLTGYDRASVDGTSECDVDKKVWDKGAIPGSDTSYSQCPQGEEFNVPFPMALAIHLVETGYLTREQSKLFGADLEPYYSRINAETADYESQLVNGWYNFTRTSECVRAQNPTSPADLISTDRRRGIEDTVVVLKSDVERKPIIVRVGQPKSGNLEDVYMFFRGRAECLSYSQQQQQNLNQLR